MSFSISADLDCVFQSRVAALALPPSEPAMMNVLSLKTLRQLSVTPN
jgi:hypothetical protein